MFKSIIASLVVSMLTTGCGLSIKSHAKLEERIARLELREQAHNTSAHMEHPLPGGHASRCQELTNYLLGEVDKSQLSDCKGSCLIVRNDLQQYMEIRFFAEPTNIPKLDVVPCVGGNPLDVALVDRNGHHEYASVLPPGESIAFKGLRGDVNISFVPVAKAPEGQAWSFSDTALTQRFEFPANNTIGYMKPVSGI